MSKTLKQQNQVSLLIFALANTCVIAVLLVGWGSFTAFLKDASGGNWPLIGRSLSVPAIAGLITGLASWVLPRKVKETLVFWRIGQGCMPSSRAFNQIAQADPRIDVARLRARLGEFPTSAAEQTSLWYSVYRKHAKEPAVEDANRAYFLYRDMTSLVVIMAVVVIVVRLFGAPLLPQNWITVPLVLVSEFLLTTIAARNAGTGVVANVLAIEGSEPPGGNPPRPATVRRRTRKVGSP